jgi:hypothetical protein
MGLVTRDLSEFGWREKRMAAKLLTAACSQGLPVNFENDGVALAMNTSSGYVFLTNSDYQVAMMNGEELETWYDCPYCGHEGFKEDMDHEPEGPECSRFLVEIGILGEHEDEEDAGELEEVA